MNYDAFDLHTAPWARLAPPIMEDLGPHTRLAVEWDGDLFVEAVFPTGEIVGHGRVVRHENSHVMEIDHAQAFFGSGRGMFHGKHGKTQQNQCANLT